MCFDTNDRGEIIEDVIAENDFCLLNEKQPTYLHPPTRNYYAEDLSLCHQKDVIHGSVMHVKRQLTNANRHYENLMRIHLVKIICIPN